MFRLICEKTVLKSIHVYTLFNDITAPFTCYISISCIDLQVVYCRWN